MNFLFGTNCLWKLRKIDLVNRFFTQCNLKVSLEFFFRVDFASKHLFCCIAVWFLEVGHFLAVLLWGSIRVWCPVGSLSFLASTLTPLENLVLFRNALCWYSNPTWKTVWSSTRFSASIFQWILIRSFIFKPCEAAQCVFT